METKVIRPIVKVGNSSGVILPRGWLNHRAEVRLIASSMFNLLGDVLNILSEKIEISEIKGIYLIGSYARKEDRLDSDVDFLVISTKTNMIIKQGQYEISVVSKESLESSLKKNIMPYVPMIVEAKPILNGDLIKELLEYAKVTKRNVKWYVDTTRLSIKENEELIKMSRELGENKVGDAIAYSLILRIRGFYIIDCLRKNKLWSNIDFVKIVKTVSGSDSAYKRYIYLKDDENSIKDALLMSEAEKLLAYLKDKLKGYEKWLNE
ncbi:MAG: nucleotidyltransferase domain-containing protein [Nanoarchaeota archaeon]|nr:nucleotidyltransferase domain-containing protein [Nanoarchaeota archaeon]